MNIHSIKGILSGCLLTLILATASVSADDQPRRICHLEAAQISSDFDGGRINSCNKIGVNNIQLVIEPESAPPINPSPWYAFRITPKAAMPIEIEIHYTHSKHRYWPKISHDGKTWLKLDKTAVSQPSDQVIKLRLPPLKTPIFIAGQEILTAKAHENWASELAQKNGIVKTRLGTSLEGRDIYKYESAATNGGGDYVVFVGRQHPPEVTGALALMAFVEAVYADTPIANRFRQGFGVVFVPILNPDGVAAGHWRHNKRDKDLNRDWGPFKQKETQLMQAELRRFADSDTLHLFLDFHSTRRNVLYTQAQDEQTSPKGFTRAWVRGVKDRVQNYEFERAERPWSELPTSKNYVYKTFGVPAITYEVGDETDRKALAEAARIFADEMMRILLEKAGAD